MRIDAGWCVPMLVAAALTMGLGTAQAARPLTTDDADVIEPRGCEVEVNYARLRTAQPKRETAGVAQLACGVGASTELAASYSGTETGGHRVEAAGLGGKLQLLHGDPVSGTRVAATVGVNLLRDQGSTFEIENHSLMLVATQGFAEKWTAHLNVGWNYSRSLRRASTLWNLAIERALNDSFDATAECYGDDRNPPWLAAGMRWTLNPTVSFNALLGAQRGAERARLFTAGITLAF